LSFLFIVGFYSGFIIWSFFSNFLYGLHLYDGYYYPLI
jgi:hypothetical protein